MRSRAMQKTNAMRILDKAKIKYNTYAYEAGDGHIDGVSVANKLSQDVSMVFKTLVVLKRIIRICNSC